jgi:sugar phosphate isomerase/epimerase
MWSRRAFIQHGSLALATLATCPITRGAQPLVGPLNRPIGIQLWTVRDDVKKDLAGALKTIASIGYREVELAGAPPKPAAEMKALLTQLGLSAPSMHAGMADMVTDAQQRIDYAKAVGAEFLIVSYPWTADSRFKDSPGLPAGMTMADWKWNAEQLNRFGALAKKAGVKFGYHNHNMEFRSFDGKVAYDELLRLTDPSLVTMEMDIGWVVAAGADPKKYLTQHADRISLLHVKDVAKGEKTVLDRTETKTTEVGSGKIDWKALFAAMNPQKIRHYFVEQENFERPPLEAAKISFEYLSRLGNNTPRAT